jgi:hypothetical protein
MICPTRLAAQDFPQVLQDAVLASEDERFFVLIAEERGQPWTQVEAVAAIRIRCTPLSITDPVLKRP